MARRLLCPDETSLEYLENLYPRFVAQRYRDLITTLAKRLADLTERL